MPYISQECRDDIDEDCEFIFHKARILCDGELNYTITKLLLGTEPQCYDDYNRLIGVLECVKMELYRRAVAPYEDRKIKKNGDIYNGI